MTRIECRVQGSDVTAAVTELGNQVNARGGGMFMADPEKVAAGDGWIAVDLPEEDRDAAEVILIAILDQIPGGRDSIHPVAPGEGSDS
jgi:hypothetical protein